MLEEFMKFIRFKVDNIPIFYLRESKVDNMPFIDNSDDYRTADLYNRIILIDGNIYHCEGFRYSDIRQWPGDGVYHNETFGQTTEYSSTSRGITTGLQNVIEATLTEAATTVSFSYMGHDSWSNDDPVYAVIYEDDGNEPGAVVEKSTDSAAVTNQAGYELITIPIVTSLSASTDYFIGIWNNSSSTTRIGGAASTGATNFETRTVATYPTIVDPWDTSDDQNLGTGNYWTMYMTYTVSGGGDAQTRRQRVIRTGAR